MARNEFGCICDRCGKYSKNKKEFYRLTLPTYQSEVGNDVKPVTFCLDCYKVVKQILKEYL